MYLSYYKLTLAMVISKPRTFFVHSKRVHLSILTNFKKVGSVLDNKTRKCVQKSRIPQLEF